MEAMDVVCMALLEMTGDDSSQAVWGCPQRGSGPEKTAGSLGPLRLADSSPKALPAGCLHLSLGPSRCGLRGTVARTMPSM